MEEQFYRFPPLAGDAILHQASRLERGARAAVRWVRGGERPGLAELAWQLRTHRAAEAGEADDAPPAPGWLLYLPAVSWSYRSQRPQHLARALAARGPRVLYLDGFLRTSLQPRRRMMSNSGRLDVLRVRIPGRPDPYREVLRQASAARLADLLAAGARQEPLAVLAQLPFWTPLALELRRRWRAPLIYDCIDLHAGFPGVPPAVARAEADLVAGADLVSASSTVLLERVAGSAGKLLLRNATEPGTFSAGGSPADSPPVAGYVGALESWFDAEAVREAAIARPAWRFHLCGRVADRCVAKLSALPNVALRGEIPYSAVAAFLSGIDVMIIPFRDSPLTRAIDPVKLYEALASGLPVVARDLPEIRRWGEPWVFTYRQPRQLADLLDRAYGTRTAERTRQRMALAAAESWDSRAAELMLAAGLTRSPTDAPR